jgi:hypothetical protein
VLKSGMGVGGGGYRGWHRTEPPRSLSSSSFTGHLQTAIMSLAQQDIVNHDTKRKRLNRVCICIYHHYRLALLTGVRLGSVPVSCRGQAPTDLSLSLKI